MRRVREVQGRAFAAHDGCADCRLRRRGDAPRRRAQQQAGRSTGDDKGPRGARRTRPRGGCVVHRRRAYYRRHEGLHGARVKKKWLLYLPDPTRPFKVRIATELLDRGFPMTKRRVT